MESPLRYLAEVRDPRGRTREHLLEGILLTTIAAVLSGADRWNEIEDYGHAKQAWPQSFLSLPGGIPSQDTCNRVFARLDPDELERCFLQWVRAIAKLTAGQVLAQHQNGCGWPRPKPFAPWLSCRPRRCRAAPCRRWPGSTRPSVNTGVSKTNCTCSV